MKPGVLIQAFAPNMFESDGNLIDDGTKDLLKGHLEAFTKWTLQIVQRREFVRYACEMDVQLAHS